MSRFFNLITIVFIAFAGILFGSAESFADGTFSCETDGSSCIVGKNNDYTFDTAIGKVSDGKCKYNNTGQHVFFQREDDGSARVLVLENSVSISLEEDQIANFWGNPVPHADHCSGSGDRVVCDYCDNVVNYDGSNLTKVEIKNTPFTQAAFEISGPGTVVFRNIIINASCDPDKVCGPVIRLSNNAKVIFQHSKIISGERVQSIVDVKNEGGTFFHNFVAFTDGESDGVTTVSAESVGVFDFDNFVHVFPGDFDKSSWQRMGFRDQNGSDEYGPNYFWEGHQTFTYIRGQGAVKCVMINSRKCRVDDSSLRFDAKIDPMFRNHPHVVLLKRGANDAAFIIEGSNFDRTEPPVILSLPSDFDFDANNYYAITNMGQHIRFVEPDADSSAGSDAEEVVCSAAHMEEDGGKCVASPGYECKDGDCSTGEALPECRGDAVPINDSPDRDARCKCPFAFQRISWSMGGISTCESIKGLINQGNFFGRDDSLPDDTTPPEETDPLDETTPPDDIDEDICPDGWDWVDEGLLGGKCVLRTEENADNSFNVENDDDISSGCSMAASSQAPSYAGLILLAIPLIALSARRRFGR